MYNDIIDFLENKRLKEALVQLTALVEASGNWSLRSEVETLKTTYGYMLEYASRGMADPERSIMYHKLIVQCYELADRAELYRKAQTFNSEYGKSIRDQGNGSMKVLSELKEILELTNAKKSFSLSESEDINQEESDHIREQHESALDSLFLQTWSSFKWSDTDYSQAGKIIQSQTISNNDKALFTSAITLSLLRIFDQKKFSLLLEIYASTEEAIISQRALIGILLVTYFQVERIKMYPQLVSALSLLKENQRCIQEARDIQILLLLSRETEKIDKKMREEIIPQMMKNSKLMNPNFKIENIEDLNDLNPEWEKGVNKFSDKIKELGELQMEGADTYMSTFSQLKSYPFFKKAAHWFYVFDKDNSAINNIFSHRQKTEKSIVDLLIDTPMFCNSDKYSFCMTIKSLNGQGMDLLKSEMTEQNELIKAEGKIAQFKAEGDKPSSLSRQYIQDLYRFFKLWMYRGEQTDIFKDKLTLWKNELLYAIIMPQDSKRHIADYLFSKDYMQEAAELYEELSQTAANDADIQQKLGYAYQKLKMYDKAIEAYKQADIIKSDHIWTMKHLAQCYRRTEKYEQALEYLYKVTEQKPDNLNVLLQIGQCLAILGKFDDALHYFYKVEYLGKAPENAQRAIGWCYFMNKRYDKAIEIYQKVLYNTEAQYNDWLNLGHVYFAKGEIPKALEYYRKVQEKLSTHDEFMQTYLKDKQALLQHNIEEENIYLMADML